jgi:hypothetical protein
MNRPVDAIDTLAEFLSHPGTATAEQKAHGERVRAEQAKRVSELVVLTDHPAVVEVDGVEVARTPLGKPIRVASGSHVVAVQAPGYLGSRREVTLAGQITETVAMTLQPTDTRMAQLVVTAAVPGAEVLVNGKRVGVTPLAASVAVPPGKVTVELQRAGYRTATGTIALDEGARGELALTLDEDPAAPASLKGRLLVTASEPGTELSIDGAPRRPLVGPVFLPVGPHRVRLERGGFDAADRTVEVVSGQDTTLLVSLVPTADTQAQLDEGRRSRRLVGWSLVGGGALVAVGGAVYAIVSGGDLTTAQNNLNVVLKNEADPLDKCASMNNPLYKARGCDAVKSAAQSDVDSARLRRTLGIAGAAVGVVTAGVGGYLLLSGKRPEAAGAVTAQVWGDGQNAGGLILSGRF